MKKRLRILIALPSDILRIGFATILKNYMSIDVLVFEVSDMFNLKEQLIINKPDLLIIEPSSIGMFKLDKIRRQAQNSNLKIAALLTGMVDHRILLPYDVAISVFDTTKVIEKKILSLKIKNTEKDDNQRQELSSREKEIVICIVKGMSNQQIADELFLSKYTIMAHRRNIASKLQIHSTAGLTIYAIVNKLVDINEVKNL
ncbi:MAG: LuxR C-terminal-related transcriptional regulator [Bacteroidales bacterium]